MLRKPRKGSRMISAVNQSRVMDGAELALRNELGRPRDVMPGFGGGVYVKVRNDSVENLVPGEAIQLDEHIGGADITRKNLMFSGILPVSPGSGSGVPSGNPCGILLEAAPASATGAVWAQLSGICMAKITLNDLDHQFAYFTAGKRLFSANFGEARILPHNHVSTGTVDVAVVLSTLPTWRPMVRFVLATALATTGSTATATITGWGTGSNEDGLSAGETGVGYRGDYVGGASGSITVYNLELGTGVYLFEGAIGARGLGYWTGADNKYVVIQMECP